jgi:hypothetical protein
VAGPRVVACPLPRAGWFPDEALPPRLPDDPNDGPGAPDPPMTDAARAGLVAAVLDAVDAVVARRIQAGADGSPDRERR